jgi:hypothetical protein
MRPRSLAGRALRLMGLYHPALVGMPLAMLADLIRAAKGLLRHKPQPAAG